MHTINITAAGAEDAVVLLSTHLPRDVAIGRVVLVHLAPGVSEHDLDPETTVLTDDAHWTVTRDEAVRMIELGDRDGLVEVTTYGAGTEVSRSLGRYPDDE